LADHAGQPRGGSITVLAGRIYIALARLGLKHPGHLVIDQALIDPAVEEDLNAEATVEDSKTAPTRRARRMTVLAPTAGAGYDARMNVTGIGRVIFWAGGSLWIGTAYAPSDLHAHHAMQFSMGLSAPLELKSGANGEWSSYPGALVQSDAPHAFRAPGKTIAHIFCEPESAVGRRLAERFSGNGIVPVPSTDAEPIAAALHAAYIAGAPDEDLEQIALDGLFALAGMTAAQVTDARVTRAIVLIRERLADELTLQDMADSVGLSAGRFRHLFATVSGIPFRVFVLWARLNRALELGFGGTAWTEAAHLTRFADSAHLSRTCRRMYGIAPSSIRSEGAAVATKIPA
jgi:AraC-like DNA-binding protein